jgi:hypothetical protein
MSMLKTSYRWHATKRPELCSDSIGSNQPSLFAIERDTAPSP